MEIGLVGVGGRERELDWIGVGCVLYQKTSHLISSHLSTQVDQEFITLLRKLSSSTTEMLPEGVHGQTGIPINFPEDHILVPHPPAYTYAPTPLWYWNWWMIPEGT